jgi:hypothetical protein
MSKRKPRKRTAKELRHVSERKRLTSILICRVAPDLMGELETLADLYSEHEGRTYSPALAARRLISQTIAAEIETMQEGQADRSTLSPLPSSAPTSKLPILPPRRKS